MLQVGSPSLESRRAVWVLPTRWHDLQGSHGQNQIMGTSFQHSNRVVHPGNLLEPRTIHM
eukprot:5486337-Amphidinium_carterae.1